MNSAFIKPHVNSEPNQAFQQDTVKPVSTLPITNVDSLFRAAEQKRKQVDSIKKINALRSLNRVAVKSEVPKVFDSLPPSYLLLNPNQTSSVFFPAEYVNTLLSDSILVCSSTTDSKVAKSVNGVFIEQKVTTTSTTVPVVERSLVHTYLPNWIFAFAFVFIAVLALVRIKYWKYVAGIFEGVIYGHAGEKLFRDRNIPFLRVSSILDFLFFGSTSVIIYLYAQQLSLQMLEGINKLLLFGAIVGTLFIFRFFRFITHRLLAMLTDSRSFFLEIYHHGALYPRALAVLSVPFAFLIAYSDPTVSSFLFYIYGIITGVVLLLRLFRFAYVFLKKGFSLFYFLLYLCALEIPPVLILWKELFG